MSSTQVQVAQAEAKELCSSDFNFLSALALGDKFSLLWPSLYLAAFAFMRNSLLAVRNFDKFALGFPRGFAKTTFIKIVALYAILCTPKKFILIVCATDELATKAVSDIMSMLSSPAVRAVFGHWDRGEVKADRQDEKDFLFLNKRIILIARGINSAARGLNVDMTRPDLIIFDDIQTKESSYSDIETTKLENTFFGTYMKLKAPFGCTFIFLANMYPNKNSLLRKLKTNPYWKKFITGAILVDGTSLWEELQPLSQLMQEYAADAAAGKADIFLSEVMNDENVRSNNFLNVNLLHENTFKNMMPHGNAVIIDPALDKKTSDLVSIGYHEYFRGDKGTLVSVFTELVEGSFSPMEIIENSLKLAKKHNCRLICVEAAGFQESLNFWFRRYCDVNRLTGYKFATVHHRNKSKNARVFELIKNLHSGDIILHENVRTHIIHEACAYNPTVVENVDGALDVCAYGLQPPALYPQDIVVYVDVINSEYEVREVITDNAPF